MRMRALRALVLAGLIGAASFGARAQPATTVPVTIYDGKTGAPVVLALEVADTPQERALGLMNRTELTSDGMIFVFDQPGLHAFWMKNTQIPLDILWLREDGRIAGVTYRMRPLDLTPREPGEPIRYAIELPAGQVRALGLRPGDRVDLSALP